MSEFKSSLSLQCGYHHTIVVPGNTRKLFGWGIGSDGELSVKEGFSEFDASEMQLPDWLWRLKGSIQVGVGVKHSAILIGGKVFTMGSSATGRLGHENKRYGLVRFPHEDESIQLISCGSAFNIAVGKNFERLYAWGAGLTGALGIGRKIAFEATPVPFKIPDGQGTYHRITQVSCGAEHAIALCEDGSVYSWGNGKGGRLGHGNSKSYLSPELIRSLVVSDQEKIVEIATGEFHNLALNAIGNVYSWGSGSYGRLGHNSERNQYTPKIIVGLKGMHVSSVSCHVYHSLAVVKATARGGGHTLYTWGGGQYGKLGHRNDKNYIVPRPVSYFGLKLRDEPVILAKCGFDFTVAITKSGKIFAWGYTGNKRCGGIEARRGFKTLPSVNAASNYVSEPILVNDGIPGFTPKTIVGFQIAEKKAVVAKLESKVQQISCGLRHCVVRLGAEEGYVMSWGSNRYGQTGTGPHSISVSPLRVNLLRRPRGRVANVSRIACGDNHTLACTTDGSVFVWGLNSDGQLGLGDRQNRNRPELVRLLQGTLITDVCGGGQHSMAIPECPQKGEQRFPNVFVWGDNSYGQLGLGKHIAGSSTPRELLLEIRPVLAPAEHSRVNTREEEERNEETHEIIPGIQASLGTDHSLILTTHENKSEGGYYTQVFAFGHGKDGKLGLGDFDSHYTYKKIHFEMQDTRKEVKGRVMIVVAGASCSLAVLDRSDDNSRHELWGWGEVHGIFRTAQNAPRCIMPAMSSFERIFSDSRRGGQSRAQKRARIVSLSIADKHALVAVSLNGGPAQVASFGSSMFGCLGIGNIVSFMQDMKKRSRGRIGNSGIEPTSAKEYPPLMISQLNKAEISLVACHGEHSIAASPTTGNIFAWGHCADGRLGLGEIQGKLAQTTPIPIPQFDPDVIEKKRKMRDDANALVEEEEDESHNVMGENKNKEESKTKGSKSKERMMMKASSRRSKLSLKSPKKGNRRKKKRRSGALSSLVRKLREVDATRVIRSKIQDQVGRYQSLLNDYSDTLNKYVDRADLARRCVLKRISQFHPFNAEKDLQKVQIASHQPLPTKTNIKDSDRAKFSMLLDYYDKNPYALNSLERVIARLHVSPYQHFVHLYHGDDTKSSDGKLSTQDSYTLREKELVVKLTMSIYKTFIKSHFQRLLILLRLVLNKHIETQKRWEMFLLPDSLEWILFRECMCTGPLKARLQNALGPALLSVKYVDGSTEDLRNDRKISATSPESLGDIETPYESLERISKSVQESQNVNGFKQMATPLNVIKLMVDNLVASLTTQFIEPLTESVKPVALVLYDALEGNNRQLMLGELIIRAIAEIAESMLDSLLKNKEELKESKKNVDERTLKLVLEMLKGRESTIRYLVRKFIIPAVQDLDYDEAESIARESLGRFPWLPKKRQSLQDRKKFYIDDTTLYDTIVDHYKKHFHRILEYLRADRSKSFSNRTGWNKDDEGQDMLSERNQNGTNSLDKKSPFFQDSGAKLVSEFYAEGRRDLLSAFLMERSVLNHTCLQLPLAAIQRFIAPLLDDLAPPNFSFEETGNEMWKRTLEYELGRYPPEYLAVDSQEYQDEDIDFREYKRKKRRGRRQREEKKKGMASKVAKGVASGGKIFVKGVKKLLGVDKINWEKFARDITSWSRIPSHLFINVRLELFLADTHLPLFQDLRCMTWTPRYPDDLGVISAQPASLDGDGNGDGKRKRIALPTEKAIDLTRRQCVRLWHTLRHKEFLEIVNGYEENEAWTQIERAITERRQRALENKENAKVEQMEWCRRQIRRLAYRDGKTLIVLDSDAKECKAYPNLDPADLCLKLNAIDTRVSLGNHVLNENLQVISRVNEGLEEAIAEMVDQTEELVRVFRRLSKSTREENKEDSLKGFLITWKNPEDHSTARNYSVVNVTRISGNIVRRNYADLIEERVLDYISFDQLGRDGVIEQGCCSCYGATTMIENNKDLEDFRKNVEFVFLTTSNPDEITFRILYRCPDQTKDLLIAGDIHLLVTGPQSIRDDESEEALPLLRVARDAKEMASNLLSLGESPVDTDGPFVRVMVNGRDSKGLIRHNPLGDRTKLRQDIYIAFNLNNLTSFISGKDFAKQQKIFDSRNRASTSRLGELLQLVAA